MGDNGANKDGDDLKNKVALSFMMAGKRAADEAEGNVPELDEGELLASTRKSIGGIFGISKELFPDDGADGDDGDEAAKLAAAEEEAKRRAAEDEAKAKAEAEAKAKAEADARRRAAPIEVERGKSRVKDPAPEPPKPDESGLTETDLTEMQAYSADARESVQFFVQAAKVDPKYKGWAKKQLDFVKANEAKMKEMREADEDFDPSTDDEYQRWLRKNQPKIDPTEARTLERKIIKQEAKEEALREMEGKIAEVEKKVTRTEIEKDEIPRIQQELAEFGTSLRDDWLADENSKPVVQFYLEALQKNPDDVQKAYESTIEEFPMEAEVVFQHYNAGAMMAAELLKIRRGLVDIDLKENLAHQALARKVIAFEKKYSEDPALRMRDGRAFLPAHKYNTLPPAERAKYWTFADNDFVRLLREDVVSTSKEQLKVLREKQEKAIKAWQRRTGSVKPSGEAGGKEEKNVVTPSPASRSPGAASPPQKGGKKMGFMLSGNPG